MGSASILSLIARGRSVLSTPGENLTNPPIENLTVDQGDEPQGGDLLRGAPAASRRRVARGGVQGLPQLGVLAHAVAVPRMVTRWQWCTSRSISAAAITSSPKTSPHSSKPLLEVSTVEACC